MAALVVFDTCTKPPYYADVHKLLALPAGSYLRYDYEEKLFSDEALATLRASKAGDMPLDAFLFYGQFHSYKKGDAEPLPPTTKPGQGFQLVDPTKNGAGRR